MLSDAVNICNKIGELKCIIKIENYDLICISEAWNRIDIIDFVGGFQITGFFFTNVPEIRSGVRVG